MVSSTTEENTFCRSASTKMTKPVETKPRDKAITFRGIEPRTALDNSDRAPLQSVEPGGFANRP